MSQDFAFRFIDETRLEVQVKSGQAINDVFELLSAQGIRVSSMRGKANRLEELFVRLVQDD